MGYHKYYTDTTLAFPVQRVVPAGFEIGWRIVSIVFAFRSTRCRGTPTASTASYYFYLQSV